MTSRYAFRFTLLLSASLLGVTTATLTARADGEKAESTAKDARSAKKTKEEKKGDEKKSSRDSQSPPLEERADDKSDKSEQTAKDAKSAKEDKADKKDAEPKPSITHHKATIAGQEIAFTATAGKMALKTDEGDPKAHVFYVAYTKDGVDDRDDRPITFCFNGGPGSASVWLHLGMLGPRRVLLDSDAKTLPPPHQLVANPHSLLDVTDLVFIDPVSTGYSRPAKDEDKRQFHGYSEDIRSVGQFIHNYTVKAGRWGSPKFLIGESYGGLRAAGLAGELQNRYHLYLNGIVLVSAVVDFQTLISAGNNDLPYVLFLPSYAATAWYHKVLSDDMQAKSLDEVVAAAEEFAAGPYLRGLAAGDSLSKEDRQALVNRMARLTGLSKDYIDRSDLRVPMARFGKELLRDRGKIVGRFDSRYIGLATDLVGDSAEYDPSASAVFGAFTSAMNDYLRTSLKVDEERVYEILPSNQVQPWDYSQFTNRFVDASSTLREAMVENPFLKVFAACGHFDLATPQMAIQHTRNHLQLPVEVRENFEMGFYEAGHMMYVHEPSLEKLRADLIKFYESALAKPEPEAND